MLELEQYAQDIAGIRKSILAAGEALHIDHMKEQIDELTEEMNQPEFWNDTERSTKVNQKLGHLKNRLEHYEGLLQSAEDIETMMELAREENDEETAESADLGHGRNHIHGALSAVVCHINAFNIADLFGKILDLFAVFCFNIESIVKRVVFFIR